MSDRLDLGPLRDGLDLPPTRVAEGAWDRGRRRVRRRRAAGAAAVAALVAAVLVPTLGEDGALRGVDPAGPRPTPVRTIAAPVADVAPVTLDAAALERLAGEATDVRSTLEVPLVGNPLERARYAFDDGGDVLVLGEDTRYRRIEVGTVDRGPLRPSSFSPDASRLALVGDGTLVVADLPSATTTVVDLPPGPAMPGGSGEDPATHEVSWHGATHVLVTGLGGYSWEVDLAGDYSTRTDLGPATAFGDDGAFTWTPLMGRADRMLVPSDPVGAVGGDAASPWYPGSAVAETPPLLGPGYAVGVAVVPRGALPDGTGRVGTSTAEVGPAVLDLQADALGAFLPVTAPTTGPAEVLALDGDVVVLSVPLEDRTLVLRWAWADGGALSGVVVLPTTSVAWGTG